MKLILFPNYYYSDVAYRNILKRTKIQAYYNVEVMINYNKK